MVSVAASPAGAAGAGAGGSGALGAGGGGAREEAPGIPRSSFMQVGMDEAAGSFQDHTLPPRSSPAWVRSPLLYNSCSGSRSRLPSRQPLPTP